ncbi:MAG TPA: tRNA (N6-isopentenyl adenosine(37)-C2)-methylthiotransferase MiaB [Vicinamibacteria bacterium]|nr:tRNA (N6-isopentenyl adenosine(37)-C2)-methylthiotransferase MiaB [Vicinamibacteria bacterium]
MAAKKSRFHIETFGCQMNVNDSEKVAGLLLADGYERAASARDADFVFINTCAVREKAAEKLFHAVGRLQSLRRQKPAMKIGVGGCVAQLEGREVLDRAPGVDLLVGTRNLLRVPELLRQAQGDAEPVVELDRQADAFGVPDAVIAHSSPVRAFVSVMEGCNHVCSFCVVPRTRGTEVCRPAGAVVAEVRSLVERGYPEVMLLGQTVNAYHHDGVDFAGLLEAVHAVPGLRRLRFTTSHPSHVGERLARALRDLPRLCPYLHLPFQSGSDRILADMRRGYSAGEYREKVALLREHVPALALTADVIVGYPGEGEADFSATVDLAQEVGFDGLFVFLYSPRPGTTALRHGDPVSEAEKKRRFQVVNANQQRRQERLNAARVGTCEEVLIDAVGSEGGLSGRTRDFRIVHLDGPPERLGRLLNVEIIASGPNSLRGVARETTH